MRMGFLLVHGFPPSVTVLWLFQEMVVATKEEDEEVSDKGSESDEAEGNKDSPSERDDESDKQSDTEADEVTGDDEEVRVFVLNARLQR